MSAATRLAGFVAVLALVFGGAAFVGSRIDARPGEPAAAKSDDAGMAGMDGKDAASDGPVRAVRGLAVSDSGLTLRLARNSVRPHDRFDLAFRIVDRRGDTVRDFDVEHTKRMHVIVVRRDMAGFQHLHPTQAADGTWSVPVTLRDAGSYRVFADFAIKGRAHTLADDLTLDGTVRSRQLPAPARTVHVDGMRVTLAQAASTAGAESELGFTVTRSGRPVAVEDYLGAKGHLVALRRGDLADLHVHPDESSLRFMARFPSAGAYRLFLQFKAEGRIHTAAFTQEISR